MMLSMIAAVDYDSDVRDCSMYSETLEGMKIKLCTYQMKWRRTPGFRTAHLDSPGVWSPDVWRDVVRVLLVRLSVGREGRERGEGCPVW